MLRDLGFGEVHRRKYKAGDLPDLDAVENRPESFFIQATKPDAGAKHPRR
jgi:hypothetical protein